MGIFNACFLFFNTIKQQGVIQSDSFSYTYPLFISIMLGGFVRDNISPTVVKYP